MTMASSNTPIPMDDVFNEYESTLKRQKSTTSKVWDEMTKLECKNKNELKVQCNHCKSIFSAKSSSRTSHLRCHLNNCLKKFDADECRRAVSTFLMCGKHSFRTVEEPRFRYMMGIASSNFKNISRYTAARDVLMYYAKERDYVKEELVKAPSLICLTSDNWNSEHTNDEYICITAHWVDKDWKLQKGIDKKFFSITLDNASYNDVMIFCLKNCFHANRAILCDVKAGLELADDDVGKIRNGIKYIKKFRIRRKRFYDVADKSFHLNVTKKLHQNVYPRYKLNSVQYCFTTIYGIHASDSVEGILSNLRLLFDEYVKKFKFTSSSLAESSNISDKNPVDSSLHQHNSEKSQLDIYLEEPKLELNSQIDVLNYWSKSLVRYNELSLLACDLWTIPISIVASESAFSMGKKVITPLRSSLKSKTVQPVVCFDDWMRAKGFSTCNYFSRFIVVIS
ncbi:hypothetical protein ERO13_D01G092050v2 [Gossypium hirsutum]|nr:hypothetical protein ERO13_D01G092050v2 [Gossypium hirsutum]